MPDHTFKTTIMKFYQKVNVSFSRFENWFEKKFSWFFTNGYKGPVAGK